MKVLLLICFLCLGQVTANVAAKAIYRAKWGNELGQYALGQYDYPDDFMNAPNSFAIRGALLFIEDTHHFRIQRIELNTKEAIIAVNLSKILRFSNILFAISNDDLILNTEARQTVCLSLSTGKFSPVMPMFEAMFVFPHSAETFLLAGASQMIAINGACTIMPDDSTGYFVKKIQNDLWYSASKSAFISNNFPLLRKRARNAGKAENTMYELPDTTQLKTNTGASVSYLSLIGYDSTGASFWYAGSDSISENSGEPINFISVYDSAGAKVVWFYEPEPEPGWKHCAQLYVDSGGRIYRMNYHRTAGLAVVEYKYRMDATRSE